MSDITDLIDSLPDDRALEAVSLLGGSVFGDRSDDAIAADVSDAARRDRDEIEAALDDSDPSEVAALARLILVVHAQAGSRQQVEDAIQAAGQRAIVLEIVVIGVLALGLVHTLFTRGRSSKKTTSTVVVAPDGTATVTVDEEVRYYSIGETLAPFVEAIIQGITPI